MTQLIVVEETFELEDGTLHFAPGVPFDVADRVRLKPGDQLQLRRPDGTIVKTRLHSVDLFAPSHGKVGLCVNKPLNKTDSPVGTEVWKID